MKQLLVYGGMPLFGKVQIEGAKNSALPVLFACLLSGETSIISRTPAIGDIHMAIQMLEAMGAKIRNLSPHRLEINTSNCRSGYRDTEHATKLRGSLYYLGAGLARFGEAYCCFPGGCNLGKRPIDQFDWVGFLNGEKDDKYNCTNL